MSIHRSPEDLSRSVRGDLLASRRSGAPPLGHLAGLHPTEAGPAAPGLAFDMERPAMAGGPGLLEVAMLADLALGGALRRRLGQGLPMPTISMSIQAAPGTLSAIRAASGEASVHTDRTGFSRSRLVSGAGDVLGDALGVFALPAQPYAGPHRPLPWDDDAGRGREEVVPACSSAPLGKDAEETAAAVREHAAGAPSQAWGSALLERRMEPAEDGIAFRPTAPLANRMGNVQGGVLFAIAVQAVAAVSDFAAADLASGTIDFAAAASTDEPVRAVVDVRRAGRQVHFATVDLVQGARLCSTVSTVLRR